MTRGLRNGVCAAKAYAQDSSQGGGAWTASYLGFVLALRPEDVLARQGSLVDRERREEWRWIRHAQQLTWLYGPDEALRRLNGGAVA
jgi:hypothetical protein